MTKIQKGFSVLLCLCFFLVLAVMPEPFSRLENIYRQFPVYRFVEQKVRHTYLEEDWQTEEKLIEENAQYVGADYNNGNSDTNPRHPRKQKYLRLQKFPRKQKHLRLHKFLRKQKIQRLQKPHRTQKNYRTQEIHRTQKLCSLTRSSIFLRKSWLIRTIFWSIFLW